MGKDHCRDCLPSLRRASSRIVRRRQLALDTGQREMSGLFAGPRNGIAHEVVSLHQSRIWPAREWIELWSRHDVEPTRRERNALRSLRALGAPSVDRNGPVQAKRNGGKEDVREGHARVDA